MQINVTKLKAALAIAPKNQPHFYLNGVHYNSELNAFEATDAHCAIRITEAGQGELLDKNIIIPIDAAKAAIAQAKNEQWISLTWQGEQAILGNTLFTPIAGEFPSFDKIMPKNIKSIATKPATFDIRLLEKWRKAQQVMDKKAIPVWRPIMIKESQAIQVIDSMTFTVMGLNEDYLNDNAGQ
jgi:hypothetical protein